MIRFATAAAALALAGTLTVPAFADSSGAGVSSGGKSRVVSMGSDLKASAPGSQGALGMTIGNRHRDGERDRGWRDRRRDDRNHHWRDRDHHWRDRDHRWRDRDRDGRGGWGGIYVDGGIYEGGGARSGFFEGGGRVAVVNGHARYDYDRGYPYDHYSSGPSVALRTESHPGQAPSCEVQWVRDERSSEQVPVRICRR